MLKRQGPSRQAVEQAALRLLARHGGQVLATARRYAASPEDAEDAYQRSLEILLTKAPTTREEELLPWLRTVVKHEAFALRRQRDRHTPVSGDGEPVELVSPPSSTHEQAERYERLRQGAEALRRLKPQEIRCLVLKARGLSYREICETTGFTYTKVNRCLTEGRQALAKQLAGIEGGAECDRLAPLLSALADGEATADQVALLRPHMKTCLACRARLREFRAAPARVAALVPVAALGGEHGRSLAETLHAVVAAAQHKAGALAERAHTAAELVTGQKVAAVAASAAALAGGGTAVDQLANHHGPPVPPPAAEAPRPSPSADSPATTAEPAPSPLPTTNEQQPTTEAAVPAAPAPAPPPPPDPAREFAPTPEASATASATTGQLSAAATGTGARSTADSTRASPRPAKTSSGAGEFAP